jgi:eukaryotic-like serine/threonine-protein kinase
MGRVMRPGVSDVAAGRVLGGKYRLERVLGVGGMGEVWSARHVELGSTVAVKLMSPLLLRDVTARTRFRREAQSAARLRSPHVVTVYDFGEDGETPYLVMELLEGQSLQQKLPVGATLALSEAAELVDQICRGLRVAHEQGIVHRDIKPSNLFVTEVEGRQLLKIVDFGIARALDDEDTKVTRTGAILGSPAFMSPEQSTGGTVSAASDLWSVAGVLYWMITGREPFAGRLVSETLHNIRTAQFIKPTQLVERAPAALDAFFSTAFAGEPMQRFGSAEQLAEAFWDVLAAPLVDQRSKVELPALISGTSPTARNPRASHARVFFAVLALSLLLLTVVMLAKPSVPPKSSDSAAPVATPDAQAEVARALPVPVLPRSSASTVLPDDAVKPGRSSGRVRPERPPPALTREPLVATSSTTSGKTDPLFGIPLKARSALDLRAAADAGAAAGVPGGGRAD